MQYFEMFSQLLNLQCKLFVIMCFCKVHPDSVARQSCPIRWTTLARHPVEKEAVFHKKTKQRK